jgi:hypothetical protein
MLDQEGPAQTSWCSELFDCFKQRKLLCCLSRRRATLLHRDMQGAGRQQAILLDMACVANLYSSDAGLLHAAVPVPLLNSLGGLPALTA